MEKCMISESALKSMIAETINDVFNLRSEIVLTGHFYSEAQKERIRRSIMACVDNDDWIYEAMKHGNIMSVDDIEGSGWEFQVELTDADNDNGIYSFEYIGSSN